MVDDSAVPRHQDPPGPRAKRVSSASVISIPLFPVFHRKHPSVSISVSKELESDSFRPSGWPFLKVFRYLPLGFSRVPSPASSLRHSFSYIRFNRCHLGKLYFSPKSRTFGLHSFAFSLLRPESDVWVNLVCPTIPGLGSFLDT